MQTLKLLTAMFWKSTILQTVLCVLVLFLSSATYAAQYTVSKDPNRVAQYSDLQLAIDNAAAGDTILIYGATTSYGTATMYKQLTLIGEGYNANESLITTVDYLNINRYNTTLSASGTTVMGLNINYLTLSANFTGSTDADRTLSDITVMRCAIYGSSLGYNYNETFTNINFINNLYYSWIYFDYSGYTDVADYTFTNCIFDGAYFYSNLSRSSGVLSTYQDLSNVKVYNSLFLNDENGILYNVVGMVFEDNIFFGNELFYADYEQITWNHNLFYLVDDAASLMTNNNVGSGNLIDQNPLFTTYPATSTSFSYSHDYTLQSSSPALTASVDGGEIGIFGGAYPTPVGAQPPVPKITEVTIQDGTSSVPVGGTINFNFKAQAGN